MIDSKSNPVFTAQFVAGKQGVKARFGVNGRIAFPDRLGPQPQIGETWTVRIVGENPRQTVYFLACIEKQEEPKPTATPVISAPGANAYEKASFWLKPIDKCIMGNMALSYYQKRAALDEQACQIAVAMRTDVRFIEDTASTIAYLKGLWKGLHEWAREAAVFGVLAKQSAAKFDDQRRRLELDMLAYRRLVQFYRRLGTSETHDVKCLLAEKNVRLAHRREVLAQNRQAFERLNNDAEYFRRAATNEGFDVDGAIKIHEDLENLPVVEHARMNELAKRVNEFEARIDRLRLADHQESCFA